MPRQSASERLQHDYRDMLRQASQFAANNGTLLTGKLPRRRLNGQRARLTAFKRLLYQAATKDRDEAAKFYLNVMEHVVLSFGVIKKPTSLVENLSNNFTSYRNPVTGEDEEEVGTYWELDPLFLHMVKNGIEKMPDFGVIKNLEETTASVRERGETVLDNITSKQLLREIYHPRNMPSGTVPVREVLNAVRGHDHDPTRAERVFDELTKERRWFTVDWSEPDSNGIKEEIIRHTEEGSKNYQQEILRIRDDGLIVSPE